MPGGDDALRIGHGPGLAHRRIERAEGGLRALATKTKILRRAIFVGVVGATVSGTIGARALAAGHSADAASALVPAGVLTLLCLLGFLQVLSYAEQKRTLRITLNTEEEAEVLRVAGGDLGPYMAFSHRQMARFECVALAQASLSHIASVVAAALGFLVLGVGAAVTFAAGGLTSTVTGATMTAIGTALSGFLSRTFLRTYETTAEQMSYYYGQPVVNCYLLHAERHLERLREAGVDDRNENKVVDALLQAADHAQKHLLYREYERRHRRGARSLTSKDQPRPAGLAEYLADGESVSAN